MDDGILERRTTSPMATACLLISFVALLGAVTFNLIEIGEMRATGDGKRDATKQRSADFTALDTKIKAILDAEAVSRKDVEEATGLGGDGGDDDGDTLDDLDVGDGDRGDGDRGDDEGDGGDGGDEGN